jgi:pimeloyl-ACP methyl ester carboxylesterase
MSDAGELFRAAPQRFIDVGFAEVAYRTVGSGPDVLFVHGWPVSSATFRRLVPHLAEHVTCHFIDLPGAGSSRYADDAPLSIAGHISAVRSVIDTLQLDNVAVVGHDSGGLIARHAVVGDPRVRSLALIDTEPSTGISWKFRTFLAGRHLPGFGAALGWLAGKPTLRRNRLVLGDAFLDRSHLDGDFDEFFLRPLHQSASHRAATMKLLKSFDFELIHTLPELHRRLTMPVGLVWGEHDRFFPVGLARAMVSDFERATITVIPNAGLFAHEEKPAETAAALLPTLIDTRR